MRKDGNAERIRAAGSTLAAASAADVLAFERAHPRMGRAKAMAIRDWWGVDPARYFARLNRILDAPASLLEDPILVARLLRVRDRRRSVRFHERLQHPAPVSEERSA